jgi:hypothetical protein
MRLCNQQIPSGATHIIRPVGWCSPTHPSRVLCVRSLTPPAYLSILRLGPYHLPRPALVQRWGYRGRAIETSTVGRGGFMFVTDLEEARPANPVPPPRSVPCSGPAATHTGAHASSPARPARSKLFIRWPSPLLDRAPKNQRDGPAWI